MAREAVKVELYGANADGSPRRLTVADGTTITKGTLLKLTDPRTAIAYSAGSTAASFQCCAGIASMEKEASDGSTAISVWTDGIFDLYASGAIGVGSPVTFMEGNYVQAASMATYVASGAYIAGYALETASDGEVINVRVRL